MNGFRYISHAQEIIFEVGSFGRLGEITDRYGRRRLLLVSTGAMRHNGRIAALENTLGSRLAAIYEHVQPHVPDFQVEEALELARSSGVDAIVAMGGGSSIGMAKAVGFALSGGQEEPHEHAGAPDIPVIAVPTTYAGSEMTPVYGVTRHDREPARKVTVSDPAITPRIVLYDPLLTLDLPQVMTASTGINSLAHCIEALYSVTRNPISTAIALGGISSITSALPRCYDDGNDPSFASSGSGSGQALEARTQMLAGAMMAGMALAHVAMGLHHGLCHVLGGTAGVPHGIANAIVLPHALRFNLDATAPELAQAAGAMRIPVAGRSAEAAAQEVIESIHALTARMNLPRRLRDVGVQEVDLPRLAELALENKAVKENPRPITNVSQTLQVLQAAW